MNRAHSAAHSAATDGLTEQPLPNDTGLPAAALVLQGLPPLRAIAYVSSAIAPLDVPELESLHHQAMASNARHGITGVLLYSDGNFMQYIEGPAPEIDRLYGRIRADARHRALIELLNEPTAQRSFAQWHMGLAQVTGSDVLALSTARWEELRAAQAAGPERSPGLILLVSFWQREQR